MSKVTHIQFFKRVRTAGIAGPWGQSDFRGNRKIGRGVFSKSYIQLMTQKI